MGITLRRGDRLTEYSEYTTAITRKATVATIHNRYLHVSVLSIIVLGFSEASTDPTSEMLSIVIFVYVSLLHV